MIKFDSFKNRKIYAGFYCNGWGYYCGFLSLYFIVSERKKRYENNGFFV